MKRRSETQLSKANPLDTLDTCLKLINQARKLEHKLANPEGRGGCWLMAFMAALWNVLWHDRSAVGDSEPTVPTIRCRIVEAFARQKLVNAWNQAVEQEGHGQGGHFATHVCKTFPADSGDAKSIRNMHVTTTKRVLGGWGGEPALTFLMAALKIKQLVILSEARENPPGDAMSDVLRVGSLITIEFDDLGRFVRMQQRVLTLQASGAALDEQSLNAVLKKTPCVPVVYFWSA